MAFRNISVVIRANVSQYTRSINTAAAATQKLSTAAAAVGRGPAAAGVAAATTANQTYSASAHAAARGMGIAKAGFLHTSAAAHMGARAMQAFGVSTQGAAGFLRTFTGFAKTAVATIASFAAIHLMISTTRRLYRAAKEEIVDFDEAITQSTAIMSRLDRQMRPQLEAAALQLSRELPVSASKAAASLFFLASAGLSASQSIGALPIVGRFATAGVMEMDKAAELLVDSVSALGLASSNAVKYQTNLVRVSDVLTAANIKSNATVEQFALSLQNKAAAAARAVGMEVEEVTAVLMAFAAQGIKGKIAGDRFNQALRDLQTQAIKNRGAFTAYGIEVFNASGEIMPMADILQDLETQMVSLNDEQKRGMLLTLGFQDRSVAAIISLLGMSGAIREWNRELKSAGGTTEDVAKRQLGSLRNQFILVKNAVLDFGIGAFAAVRKFGGEVGNRIAPITRNLGRIFTDVARAVGPFVKLMAVIAGSAVGAVLSATATAVEKLTDFLSKHSFIVTSLVALYGIRWVAGLRLASGAVTLFGNVVYKLGFTLSVLKAAALAAATNVRFVAAAVVAAGRAGAGLGALRAAGAMAAGGIGAAVAAAGAANIAFGALAVGAGLLAWHFSKNSKAAQKSLEETRTKVVQNPITVRDFESNAGAYERWAEQETQAIERARKKVADSSGPGPVGFITRKVTDWVGNDKSRKERENFEKEAEMFRQKAVNVKRSLRKVQISISDVWTDAGSDRATREIYKVADALGVDLSQALQKSDPEFQKLVSNLEAQERNARLAGMSVKEAFDPEVATRFAKAGEEMAEDFQGYFDAMIDPIQIFKDELDIARSAMKGFADPGSVFGDLTDAATKASRKTADARKEAIDDRIAAMEDEATERKNAIADEARDDTRREQDRNARRAKGTKARNTASRRAQDEAREDTRAIDAELKRRRRSLQDEKDRIDEEAAEVTPRISLQSYSGAIEQAAKQTEEYRNKIKVLTSRGLSPLAAAIGEMGEEGVPLLNEVVAKLQSGGDRALAEVQAINANIAKIGEVPEEEIQLSLESLTTKMTTQADRQTTAVRDMFRISVTVWRRALEDPELMKRFQLLGITGPEQLAHNLSKLGPEASGAIHQLAEGMAKDGGAAVSKFVEKMVEAQRPVATTIGETFKTAADIAGRLAIDTADKSVQGILEKLKPLEREKVMAMLGWAGFSIRFEPRSMFDKAAESAISGGQRLLDLVQGSPDMIRDILGLTQPIPTAKPAPAPAPPPAPAPTTRAPVSYARWNWRTRRYEADGGIVSFSRGRVTSFADGGMSGGSKRRPAHHRSSSRSRVNDKAHGTHSEPREISKRRRAHEPRFVRFADGGISATAPSPAGSATAASEQIAEAPRPSLYRRVLRVLRFSDGVAKEDIVDDAGVDESSRRPRRVVRFAEGGVTTPTTTPASAPSTPQTPSDGRQRPSPARLDPVVIRFSEGGIRASSEAKSRRPTPTPGPRRERRPMRQAPDQVQKRSEHVSRVEEHTVVRMAGGDASGSSSVLLAPASKRSQDPSTGPQAPTIIKFAEGGVTSPVKEKRRRSDNRSDGGRVAASPGAPISTNTSLFKEEKTSAYQYEERVVRYAEGGSTVPPRDERDTPITVQVNAQKPERRSGPPSEAKGVPHEKRPDRDFGFERRPLMPIATPVADPYRPREKDPDLTLRYEPRVVQYAEGGMAQAIDKLQAPRRRQSETHVAQIAKPGDWRVWAEPETGGEAYIPMAMAKRSRSMSILKQVADHFGYDLTPYAWGGMTASQQVRAVNPAAAHQTPSVIIQPVPVPISKETTFKFGDLQGPTMKDILQTAQTKARIASLAGAEDGRGF